MSKLEEYKQRFGIRELPEEFVEWNLGKRREFLRAMIDAAERGQRPRIGSGQFGHHLPVYVTQNPPEEPFPANMANKGTGFVAREQYLAPTTRKFRDLLDENPENEPLSAAQRRAAAIPRLRALLEFYEHPERIDLRALAGLEIWPGKTSRNFRLDPRVSLHFMGMPAPGSPNRYIQWQIDCIWEEIVPGDPRYEFGDALRRLTLGHVGRTFVSGHIPLKDTPVGETHPSGWILWVVNARDKSIAPGKTQV